MSDAELVRQARAGRTEAFAELARRWAGRVTAVCHARVGRAHVADDLAQETLLRGFRSLASLTDPDRFGPWLCGIALRACLDWLKSKQNQQIPFSALGPGHCPEDYRDERGGESDAERADEHRRLLAEVEALPDDCRQVVMLYYYEDVTYRDLGRLLGVSPATINARLTRARALLRARLTDCRSYIMDCEQAVALISARLDHEIQPDDRALLDRHLRDCPACRATAEAFALQHQELRGAFEPRRAAVAAVAGRVASQLPSGRKAKRAGGRGWAVRAVVVLGGVAACAAIVLLAHWWLEPPPVATNISKPLPSGLLPPDELTPRPRPEPPAAAKLAVGESVETKAGQKRRLALPDGSVLYVNQNTKLRLDADRRATLTAGAVFLDVSPRTEAEDGAKFVVETPYEEIKALGTKFEAKADAANSGVLVTQGRVNVRPTKLLAVASLETLLADGGIVQAGRQFTSIWPPAPAPRASHELDWTRDLMAAAESPLVPASQYDGGALIAVDPYGQEAKLSLRNYHIDVHIEDGFARTTIDQTYFNNNPWRLEGTFYFPLPPDASLSRLAMYVNGDLMEGGMTDREWGNAVYEKVVRSQRDPALLEWVDGSTFKMRVFPLEGRQEKRIVLSYTQRLSTLYGRTQYRFPAGHSLQDVDHWSFHALVKSGGADAWNSPSHPALRGRRDGDDLLLDAAEDGARVDRDVEVDFIDPQETSSFGERVRFSGAEHEGADYLMLRFRPDLPARAERQRRDWVFLFESSADRDPLLARAQIDIIRHMLEHAEHDDTFSVLRADTTTERWAMPPVPPTPENVATATAFLEGTHLIGALDLGRALTDAAPMLQAVQNPYLVHIGSGQTAMGRRQETLAELLPAGVRYIGVGVGKHWNRSWMKERAESTGGYFTQINPDEPIAWRAFDLVSTLNTPRLLHVRVTAGGDAEEPRFLTDQALVAQGEEICAVARIGRNADGTQTAPRSVVVTGVLDGQDYRRELPVRDVAPHADYLPRTWAKREIDRLLAESPTDNRPRIVELSKAMYVMTPFTSLLVLENEAMYKEYNVDRGRKDYWAMYPCPQKIPVVFEPDPTQPIDVRNAPKTPKPVANLVRPTLVARGTPRFLGGVEPREGEPDQGIIDKLKKSMEGQERLVARVSQGDLWFKAGGRRGDDRYSHFGRYAVGLTDEDSDKADAFIKSPDPRGTVNEPEGLNRPEGETSLWSASVENNTRQWDLNRTLSLASHGALVALPTLPPAPSPLSNGEMDYLIEAAPAVKLRADWDEAAPAGFMPARPVDDAPVSTGRAHWKGKPAEYRKRIESGWTPNLVYQPPTYTGDARLFSDLVSYAPGLNTSDADIRAVLDAEAAPNLAEAPGHIDPDARRLIDQSRRPRWRTLSVAGEKDKAELHFHFDGAGRYVYEQDLPLGLHERVVCDGATLWHLYPELGLAARRTVSRFHRAEVAGLTPWTLPPAEDLARGADVQAVDAHTVALVPLGALTRRTVDDKPAPYYRLKLIFAADGRLAERRLEEAPAGKVVLRQLYDDNGGVRALDGDGKELSSRRSKVAEGPTPDLSADTANLVVLALPLRSRDRVFEDAGLDASRPLADEMNGCYPYLDQQEAVELLAGAMTEGNAEEARLIFRDCFAAHGDMRRGLFTLLAAAGATVCTEPAFQAYLTDHKDDPLARYFALLGNPAYERLHAWTPLGLGKKVGPADGFLGRLAAFHDLESRWQAGPSAWVDAALQRADETRTFDYIRRNHDNALGWALQIHVQNRAPQRNQRLRLALAETWGVLAGDDEAYTARYEQARCLLQAGKREEAAKRFGDLHARAFQAGALPRIDADFRRALEADADGWSALEWNAASDLLDKKDRPSVVLLAWQCRQIGDEPLSDNLLAFLLGDVRYYGGDRETALAAVEYFWQTDQLPAAEDLLNRLIESDPANGANADLWRLAATIAERRQRPARATECLERALDLEYRDLPPVIDLQAWRTDYGKLLSAYQAQADHASVPEYGDLAARTIRAADRWRAHDPDATAACQTAAAILRTVGEDNTAWEYLTTPAALRAGAVSWTGTGQDMSRQGKVDLADRAFAAACEQDPDDALLVWQRAMSLRQAGWSADELLHQLADGPWPERYQWVRARAKWLLGRGAVASPPPPPG